MNEMETLAKGVEKQMGQFERYCAENPDITIRDQEVDHGWSQKSFKEETFAQLEEQS